MIHTTFTNRADAQTTATQLNISSCWNRHSVAQVGETFTLQKRNILVFLFLRLFGCLKEAPSEIRVQHAVVPVQAGHSTLSIVSIPSELQLVMYRTQHATDTDDEVPTLERESREDLPPTAPPNTTLLQCAKLASNYLTRHRDAAMRRAGAYDPQLSAQQQYELALMRHTNALFKSGKVHVAPAQRPKFLKLLALPPIPKESRTTVLTAT